MATRTDSVAKLSTYRASDCRSDGQGFKSRGHVGFIFALTRAGSAMGPVGTLTGSYPELEVLNPVCGMTYVISILSVNVRVYLLRHQCTVRQCACVLTSSVHCPSMCVCTYYVISVLFVNVRVYLLRHQCTVLQCAYVLTTSSVYCPSMCVCTYYVIRALSVNVRVYLQRHQCTVEQYACVLTITFKTNMLTITFKACVLTITSRAKAYCKWNAVRSTTAVGTHLLF